MTASVRLRYHALVLIVSMAGFAAAAACGGPAETPAAPAAATPPAAPAPDPIQRGNYIATTAYCHDCHTPFKMGANGPEPDMSRMLQGHPEELRMPPPPKLDPKSHWMIVGSDTDTAWAGPWGVSYTANLTPNATGIGPWTESMFVNAMRQGKHLGVGRPILPPMPWSWIGRMTDEDLKALFAYLKSIPAIPNHVPEPAPPAGAPAKG